MNPENLTQSEDEFLQTIWHDLGSLPRPEPSAALRAQFYQKLNAIVHARPVAPVQASWWKRAFLPQILSASALLALGFLAGHRFGLQTSKPSDMTDLRTQVEGLRQTVALSLMEKPSATSRLQGVEWSSQVAQPDHELISALVTTLNQDQNINVRLASLDALEKFTSDATVRKALEQSIPTQQSPLVQIALIDALVHIRDNGVAPQLKQLTTDTSLNAAVRQRAQWGLQKLTLE